MVTKIYILLLAVTFLSSLKSLRLDIPHYKAISCVLAFDLFSELIQYKLYLMGRNNMPICNLTTLIEFWIYGYYFSLIITNIAIRKLTRIYLVVLPVAWLILALVLGEPDQWNSYFYDFGCIPTVLLSAIYYHQLFTAEKLIKLTASFEFWVATALIIYFTGSLPYLGILRLLNSNYMDLAHAFLLVTQILNYIFYAILLYAYIWAHPIEKS